MYDRFCLDDQTRYKCFQTDTASLLPSPLGGNPSKRMWPSWFQKKKKKLNKRSIFQPWPLLTHVIKAEQGALWFFRSGFWDKSKLKVVLNGDYRWEIVQGLLGTRLNPRVWQKWDMASCSSFIRSKQIICSWTGINSHCKKYITQLRRRRRACFGAFMGQK